MDNRQQNMKQLWTQLRSKNPDIVARNSGTIYEDGVFKVKVIDRLFIVDPENEVIKGVCYKVKDYFFIVLVLSYLVGATPECPTGRWISPRSLRNAAAFFAGGHDLPVKPLIEMFGHNLDIFIKAAEKLGAKPYGEIGDSSYVFYVFPKIPVVVIIYEEDEEFPAEARFLVDPTIEKYLSLDAVRGVLVLLVNRIIEAAKSFS